jgi:hypothetical protein
MKILGLRADQKGLELAYDIQPDVPAALIGDPGRLKGFSLAASKLARVETVNEQRS